MKFVRKLAYSTAALTFVIISLKYFEKRTELTILWAPSLSSISLPSPTPPTLPVSVTTASTTKQIRFASPEMELTRLLSAYCNSEDRISKEAQLAAETHRLLSSQYTLAQIHVVTRHGIRAPIFRFWPLVARKLYECPPHGKYDGPNLQLTDCGGPWLTLPGCNQHKALGNFFRNAYELDSIPNLEKRVKLISSSYQRTMQSGLCFFDGLLKGTAIPATGIIKGMNAAFSKRPLFRQGSLGFPPTCIEEKKLFYKEKLKHPSYQNMTKAASAVVQRVIAFIQSNGSESNKQQMASVKSLQIHTVADALYAHYCQLYATGAHKSMFPCINNNHYCIPAGLVLDALLANDELIALSNPEKIAVLTIQPMLAQMIAEMGRVVEMGNASKEEHPLFVLYSGHDITVLPLVVLFDAFERRKPAFASRIVVELWRNQIDSRDFRVRVLYNGRAVGPAEEEEFVPFEAFRNKYLAGPFRDVESYERECTFRN